MAGFVQSNTESPRLPLFYQVVTTSTSGLQNAIPTKSSVHVCVILPSSELTYAIPASTFEDHFPFPVWWNMDSFPGG